MIKDLLFRKCSKDFTSHDGKFTYPREGWVEAPDWSPTKECGGGLHALRVGDWLGGYLRKTDEIWQVFTDYEDLVDLKDHVKVRRAYVKTVDITEYKEYFLRNATWALYYASCIDKAPADDTRAAACKEAVTSYQYARYIDEKPRDDTRKGACASPMMAYKYALIVELGTPHDDTRAAVAKDPGYAKLYHDNIDNLIPGSLVDEVLTPRVGVFYITNRLPFGEWEGVKVRDGQDIGDYIIYPGTQEDFWKRRISYQNPKHDNSGAYYFPRGKVVYNKVSNIYEVSFDRHIWQRNHSLNEIIWQMRLPFGKIKKYEDPTYECYRCRAEASY